MHFKLKHKITMKLFVLLVSLIGFSILSGCEAKLNLDGVKKEEAKSSLRTDQYQKLVISKGEVIMVGSQGLVLRSKDKGASWTREIVKERPDFIGLSVCPDGSLIAMSFNKRLWKSTDNGGSWTSQAIKTDQDVIDLCCAPDGSYWVTGSFTTLLHSTDGGASWQSNSLGEDAMLTQIRFFDEKNGVVAGEFGLFYKTTDAGASWEAAAPIAEEFYTLSLYFKDRNTGWAGSLGVIMKTSDGGASWTRQQMEIPVPIYNFIGEGDKVFALGDQCTVLALHGDQWQRIKTPKAPVYLSPGLVLDDKNILIAGGFGMLLSLPVAN